MKKFVFLSLLGLLIHYLRKLFCRVTQESFSSSSQSSILLSKHITGYRIFIPFLILVIILRDWEGREITTIITQVNKITSVSCENVKTVRGNNEGGGVVQGMKGGEDHFGMGHRKGCDGV